MNRAFVAGVGCTAFGRREGFDSLDLMAEAATEALGDGGFERPEIDGLLTGYSTAMPHLMLSTLFAEHFGLAPRYAHAIQLGGATGGALVMLAKLLVESGQCRNVLVVAGENRLSNPGGRDSAIQTLAQVGHAEFEVPYGATVPGYYALLASAYMAAHGISEEDLAELAVLMRAHAARHAGAHLSEPITVEDVMASRRNRHAAEAAGLLPDLGRRRGAAGERRGRRSKGIRLAGAGQAHTHQHISAAPSLTEFAGASAAAGRAFEEAGLSRSQVGVAGIYDSFTITLAILLEEIGFAPRGGAGARARQGGFGLDGDLPLNTHGGLLSFGHSGVAGGMAHVVEVVRQMAGAAGARQLARCRTSVSCMATAACCRRMSASSWRGSNAMQALKDHCEQEARAGRLAYQTCRSCGHAQVFPRPFCSRCGIPTWRGTRPPERAPWSATACCTARRPRPTANGCPMPWRSSNWTRACA
jgi:acetyl-CoA C-acetyltransferase